jgi:hypothetical protein
VCPPTQPQLTSNCFAKIVGFIDSCYAKAKKDWNLKPSSDPKGRNACCANWDIYDCFQWAAQAVNLVMIFFHSI